jgi:GPH family glycoside/pentoside/hexuronide:cation symporter
MDKKSELSSSGPSKSLNEMNPLGIRTKHSIGVMASYGFGKFAAEFFTLAFTTWCFYFYETELGLNTGLVAIGYIIYALWNSFNDPIVGYLTNKSTFFIKKYGRRMPWIILSSIPWVFIYILIFTPPTVDAQTQGWVLFIWLTVWSCVFDTLYSIWDVNYQSIFPDKFRGDNERRKAAGVGTIVGVFGIALGSILPPIFLDYGDIQSYSNHAVALAFIGLAAVLAMIPGVKETKEMRSRDLKLLEATKIKDQAGFFTEFKNVLKSKNLFAFLLLYFLYQSLTQSMTGSIPYYVKFVLEMDADIITYVMAGFLVGALISIPVWTKIANKVNDNKKMILVGAVLLIVITVPFIFIENLIAAIILMVFWGMALGLIWAMIGPVMADAIDEIVAKNKKRDEGMYMGFRAFFGRLAFFMQALNFWLVHHFTDFREGSVIQPDSAIFGIHIHMALVPIILLIIGVVLFWKMYNLTPEKSAQIKAEINQLAL